MRVNISYSIQLDEVPDKVGDLLQQDLVELKRQVLPSLDETVVNLSTSDINRVALSLEEIEKTKRSIEDLAAKMADYSNILKGFLNAKIQLAANKQASPTTPPIQAESKPEVNPSNDDQKQEIRDEPAI